MSFEPHPFPERIVKVSMPISAMVSANEEVDRTKPHPQLSIGVQLMTEDNHGLKIMPHKAIVFAFGDTDDPEQIKFDVGVAMARDLFRRGIEMCDAIDAEAKAKS